MVRTYRSTCTSRVLSRLPRDALGDFSLFSLVRVLPRSHGVVETEQVVHL